VASVLFEETSTIGLRYYETNRLTLKRRIKKIETKYGAVNVKISKINAKNYRVSPEYEDCKRLAKKLGLPLQEIYQNALEKVGA